MSVSLFSDDDDWLPSGQGEASIEAVPVEDNETLDLFPLTPTGISSDNEYPVGGQSCTPALVTNPNGNNSDSVYPQPCQSSTPKLGLPPTTETSSSSTDREDTALAKERRKGGVRGINLFRLSHTLSSETKTYNFCMNLGLFLPKTAKWPTCKCILKRIYKVKRCGRQREKQRFQCKKKNSRIRRTRYQFEKDRSLRTLNLP